MQCEKWDTNGRFCDHFGSSVLSGGLLCKSDTECTARQCFSTCERCKGAEGPDGCNNAAAMGLVEPKGVTVCVGGGASGLSSQIITALAAMVVVVGWLG